MDPTITAIVALWNNPSTRPVCEFLAAFWIISSALHGLPVPDQTSGKLYIWFFKTVQCIFANFAMIAKLTHLQSANQDAQPQIPPAK